MNFRALRVRLTILYGLVCAFAVVALAAVAVDLGERRIDETVRNDAREWVLDTTIGSWRSSDTFEAPDTWYVRVPDTEDEDQNRYVEPLGTTAIEPPYYALAEAALSAGEVFDRFSQNGETYLAYAKALGDDEVFLTAVDLSDASGRKASLRWRIALFGVVVVGLAAWGGWFVAGRSLRPARRMLAEQRGFLADAAHEMRTPLAIIQASASQSLSRSRTSEEYVRSLAEIRAASERAAAGVNELLDLARFDAGQAIPRLAPLRLDLLAEEVAAAVRADDCTVEAPVSPSVVVDADMALLRQALENVVRNATRRASHVTLRTHVDGRDGVVEVADDGPGFDPAALGHVFERFRRGDERGQAGLGLAIVRAILRAHGGEAEAANREPGGAVIRLRVPLTRADV